MTGHATSATRVLVAVSAKVSAAALCTTLARWRREEQGLRITACTACLNLADSVPGKGGEERRVLHSLRPHGENNGKRVRLQ